MTIPYATREYYLTYGAAVLIVIAIIFLLYIKKRAGGPEIKEPPAEFWFYLRLLDIELGVLPAAQLVPQFLQYLERRYHAAFTGLKQEQTLELLTRMETDPQLLAFEQTLTRELFLVQQDSPASVIAYVKDIKFNFNRADLAAWLAQANRPRNNC